MERELKKKIKCKNVSNSFSKTSRMEEKEDCVFYEIETEISILLFLENLILNHYFGLKQTLNRSVK